MITFNPKVSIIIPVYNGSNYLKNAIDSALAQTYKNIEIIVVNDGSTDSGATERIAQSYGNKIKYYKKPNGGVATALNLGIHKMTGDYFSWLSHDDLYYQDKVERQINFLSKLKSKKVFLYSNYAVLQGKKITPVKHGHEMLSRKPKYSLLRGCVNGITVLVPKSVFDEMGEFDPKLRCTQDYDYWRRIEKKYEFIHMDDVLSITRLHPHQDSNVSLSVVEEGNALWIDMLQKMPEKEKIEYEGTLYNFYFEMAKFLETTPYDGALGLCKKKLVNLEASYKEEIPTHKVSIVVPFYNHPENTIKALKSALGQSYKNIEVILIDDGSTADISQVHQFVKKHNNITLLKLEKNSGPGAARNIGIENSTGEYIAFLDSDDEFLSNKIEKQLLMMSKHNLNIGHTAYLRREAGKETVERHPELNGIVVPQIITNCAIATPTVIIRKNLLTDNRIEFNSKIRAGEDICFWLEIAKHSEILFIDEPLTVVNVDHESHARDYKKSIAGMKNILSYLLNDDYYSEYTYDISLLCRDFFGLNSEVLQREYNRILVEGPVVSEEPSSVITLFKRFIIALLRQDSLAYRIARKLYLYGPSATVEAVRKRFISAQ